MNDNERQFEDFVSNIKFDDTPDSGHRNKLEQDLLRVLTKQPRHKEQSLKIWRIIMKSRITKLAMAAAVLIVGLVFLVGDGQQTLYAKAVEALEQARTVHVVVKEYRDGQWFKGHEIWYDREAGIVEEERYEGRTDLRIDNGRYEWLYAVGRVTEILMNLPVVFVLGGFGTIQIGFLPVMWLLMGPRARCMFFQTWETKSLYG